MASLYAFVRIITNRRIMGDDAVALRPAWDAAEAFRRQASVVMVGPGRGHPNVAAELIATPGLTSTDVPDVQLAAVAVERGLTVATHDHGFGRFSNLRWFDPLA